MYGNNDIIFTVTDMKDIPNTEEAAETSLKLEDDNMKKKNSLGLHKHEGKKFLQIFIAEVIATALLMCLGCMGGIVGFDGTNSVNQLQPAFVFGFVVCSLIAGFGHISGAHMNPAVTVCFYMMGTINAILVPIYFIAEIIGALLGVGLLLLITPSEIIGSNPVCTTVPHASLNIIQAVGVEFLSTTLLLLVLLGCNDLRNADKQDSVPLKFGAVIITLSLLAGPYTGASLNPARSFAPALWFKEWRGQWVYWVGPLLSGLVTPLTYQSIFPA